MTVDQAIPRAMDAVEKLFSVPEAGSGQDFRLEEVVYKDDGSFEVTISFHLKSPRANVTPLGGGQIFDSRRAAIGVDSSRVYKDVHVGNDGNIKAIHMRPIVLG